MSMHRRGAGFFDRLHRYPRDGWIAGVCAGLAEFFDWNVKLIRVIFIAAFIVSGFFPVGLVYLVLWYLMDEADARPAGSTAGGSGTTAPFRAPPTADEVKARFSRLEGRLRNMEACVTSDEFELRRELRKLES
jgi:phage shock protein C